MKKIEGWEPQEEAAGNAPSWARPTPSMRGLVIKLGCLWKMADPHLGVLSPGSGSVVKSISNENGRGRR